MLWYRKALGNRQYDFVFALQAFVLILVKSLIAYGQERGWDVSKFRTKFRTDIGC